MENKDVLVRWDVFFCPFLLLPINSKILEIYLKMLQDFAIIKTDQEIEYLQISLLFSIFLYLRIFRLYCHI